MSGWHTTLLPCANQAASADECCQTCRAMGAEGCKGWMHTRPLDCGQLEEQAGVCYFFTVRQEAGAGSAAQGTLQWLRCGEPCAACPPTWLAAAEP